jgi:hypothetical protein
MTDKPQPYLDDPRAALAGLGELLHFAGEFNQHGEGDDEDPDEDEGPDPNGFEISNN